MYCRISEALCCHTGLEAKGLKIPTQLRGETTCIHSHTVVCYHWDANLLEKKAAFFGIRKTIPTANSVLRHPVIKKVCEWVAIKLAVKGKVGIGSYLHSYSHLTPVLKEILKMLKELFLESIHLFYHSFLQEHGQFCRETGFACSTGRCHLLGGVGIKATKRVGDRLLGANLVEFPSHFQENICLCTLKQRITRTQLLSQVFQRKVLLRHEFSNLGHYGQQVFI